MVGGLEVRQTRRFALVAVLVFLLEEFIGAWVMGWEMKNPSSSFSPLGQASVVFTHWIMPLLAIYLLERRDYRSLGLVIPPKHHWRYAVYAMAAFVLPAAFVGVDRELLVEFADQAIYIGLAEEVFFRGYMQTRLSEWLGRWKGLLASAVLFSLAHFVSRVAQQGFAYPQRLVQVSLETLIGGLIFGLIYMRSGSVIPVSILHMSTNMYLGRIINLFGG
jgi:membrane protease YdiL (CAAX protease family)